MKLLLEVESASSTPVSLLKAKHPCVRVRVRVRARVRARVEGVVSI